MPFASGGPVELTTLLDGTAETGALVGFGSAGETLGVLGLNLDLTGSLAGPVINFAFSVPRDGVITELAAYFSVTIGLNLVLGTLNVVAQLYESTTPDNTFTLVPGASVSMPFSGLISLGDIGSGITALNHPVTAGTRLLLVFGLEGTGITLAAALTGYASGGLAIEFA